MNKNDGGEINNYYTMINMIDVLEIYLKDDYLFIKYIQMMNRKEDMVQLFILLMLQTDEIILTTMIEQFLYWFYERIKNKSNLNNRDLQKCIESCTRK